MRLDVVSLAPEALAPLQGLGVIGRAMAAGIAALSSLKQEDPYPALEAKAAHFEAATRENMIEAGLTLTQTRVGSMACLFFTDRPVTDYASAVTPQRPAPAPTVDEDDDEIVDDVPVLDDDEVADDTDDEVVAASPTSDDDEEVELTIDDLRSMSVAELKALAAELGVAIVPNMKKAALIEQVWEAI